MICELSAAGGLDRSHPNIVVSDVLRRKRCVVLLVTTSHLI